MRAEISPEDHSLGPNGWFESGKKLFLDAPSTGARLVTGFSTFCNKRPFEGHVAPRNQQKTPRYHRVCCGTIISSCGLKVKKTFYRLLKVETNRTEKF